MITYLGMLSGNRLVGEFVSENDDFVVLKRPMEIGVVKNDNTSYFTMTVYSYVADDLSFSKRYVLERAEVGDQVAELYLKSMSGPAEEPQDVEDVEELDENASAPILTPKRLMH